MDGRQTPVRRTQGKTVPVGLQHGRPAGFTEEDGRLKDSSETFKDGTDNSVPVSRELGEKILGFVADYKKLSSNLEFQAILLEVEGNVKMFSGKKRKDAINLLQQE